MKEIKLTQGKVAKVSDHRYEYLNQFKWQAKKDHHGNWYAARWEYGKTVRMHQDIMGKSPKVDIDHVDGDGLNNQDENLRNCTHAQNMQNVSVRSDNQSGFKGVSKKGDKWRAYIKVDGKQISLSSHSTAEEAATAYDVAAVKHFGQYARLNFPEAYRAKTAAA